MQNVSFKDMYNVNLHQKKYNGHVSHSSRITKKDRKGCKKGKIETILKNKMVNACNRLAQPIASNSLGSVASAGIKKVLSYNTVPKNNAAKHDADDPYTFTDIEPSYQSSSSASSSTKKESPLLKNINPPSQPVLKNINPSPISNIRNSSSLHIRHPTHSRQVPSLSSKQHSPKNSSSILAAKASGPPARSTNLLNVRPVVAGVRNVLSPNIKPGFQLYSKNTSSSSSNVRVACPFPRPVNPNLVRHTNISNVKPLVNSLLKTGSPSLRTASPSSVRSSIPSSSRTASSPLGKHNSTVTKTNSQSSPGPVFKKEDGPATKAQALDRSKPSASIFKKPSAPVMEQKRRKSSSSSTSGSKVHNKSDKLAFKQKGKSAGSTLMSKTLGVAKQKKWKKSDGTDVKHEALQRIQSVVTHFREANVSFNPLGKLGDESSESEEEMVEGTLQPDLYQKQWLSNTMDYMQREEKILQLKNELQRRLGQMVKTVKLEKKIHKEKDSFYKSLLEAAKHVPNETAAILDPGLSKNRSNEKLCTKLLLKNRKCRATACDMRALPCATHCSRHILKSSEQKLFCHCAAVSGLGSCALPALNIYPHPPLCFAHKSILGQHIVREKKIPFQQSPVSGSQPLLNTPASASSKPPISRLSSAPSRKATPRKKPKSPTIASTSKKNRKKNPKTSSPHQNETLTAVVNSLPSQQPSSSSKSQFFKTSETSASSHLPPPPPFYSSPVKSVLSQQVPQSTLLAQHTGPLQQPVRHLQNIQPLPQHHMLQDQPLQTIHHVPVQYTDLGIDEQMSEAVLAIASMDPEELANQASRLLEEHDQLSVEEFGDLFSVEEVSEEVLTIANQDPDELQNQASGLLEHDELNNVLNQIPPETFNELFSEDKSVVYEPTKEEADSLLRLLEDPDNSLAPNLIYNNHPNGFHLLSTSAQDLRHS